ncbi:MAG: MFS transporter [Legionellales bacterium]|nr:MFS transporter [Legionellales bacterium]
MMRFRKPTILQGMSHRRILITAFLAFSSGLPFSLTGTTLQAWLSEAGMNIKTIGLLGLVGLPYVLKFLWSPLMDRFVPPFLDRRRGWIALMQLGLFATLLAMATWQPHQGTWVIASLALLVAFFSASQDIVIDAYRADLLHDTERGLGAAVTMGGYRLAIIVSGAFALGSAYYIGWHLTYAIMAVLMLIWVGITCMGETPSGHIQPPRSLHAAVIEPFIQFLSRSHAVGLLLLIMTYKLGDAFASSLVTPFLLKGLGFNLIQVAEMNKLVGMLSSIVGSFVGGFILLRLDLYRALLGFGVLQAISNVMYLWLALAGKVYWLLALTVFAENFCSGLGLSAYFALLMALCDKRYSATQYALFSAAFALVRVLISPLAGAIAAHFGWIDYFIFSIVLCLPGLLLVLRLRKLIIAL